MIYESKKKKGEYKYKMGTITHFQRENFPYWENLYPKTTARNKQGFVSDKWVQQGFLACMNI